MIPISADTVLFNGRIATLDPVTPEVRAVAIRYGRFIAVGDDKDIQAYKGPSTKVIDLKGRTVIPGLNDSHIHVIRGGLNYNMELRWDGVPRCPSHCVCLKSRRCELLLPNGFGLWGDGQSSSS